MPLTHNLSRYILTASGQPTAALADVLRFFNITHQYPLAALIQETQQKWLRPGGTERWELPERLADSDRIIAHALFARCGLIDALYPKKKIYDYLLFMGGDLYGMHERLTALLTYLDEGIEAKNIIFLTAQRPLDPTHEAAQKIASLIPSFSAEEIRSLQTEYDLLKLLWHHSASGYQTIAHTFVNTPNHIKEGKWARATTPDTLQEWLKKQPAPGTCLMISSQPLIGYQESVTRSVIFSTETEKPFTIWAVGPASARNSSDEYLDTLARWLYQEGIFRKIV